MRAVILTIALGVATQALVKAESYQCNDGYLTVCENGFNNCRPGTQSELEHFKNSMSNGANDMERGGRDMANAGMDSGRQGMNEGAKSMRDAAKNCKVRGQGDAVALSGGAQLLGKTLTGIAIAVTGALV
jgi:hypothetical protein